MLLDISSFNCRDKKTNLRKERFILAHGFRAGLSSSIALRSGVRNKSWQRGMGAKRSYSPSVSQDRQEGTKAIYRLQRHTPNNLLNGVTHMQGGSSLFRSSYPQMALFYLNWEYVFLSSQAFVNLVKLTLRISITVESMLRNQLYHVLSIASLNNSFLHVNILENSIDPILYSYKSCFLSQYG